MLFEFDAEQRLWQDTVRKAVLKECPPALVRAVVDDGADPAPLWRAYADLGWTELTDPADAVELAIVLEELGRATDPTPYLATLTRFAPLAPGFGDPGQSGTAVYEGVTARPADGGWVLDGTARHVLDGDRADHFAVVTDAGVFVVPAAAATAVRTPVLDPVLHLADVTFERVGVGGSELRESDTGWLLVPDKVVEPMGTGRASDALSVLRTTKRATDRYLARRGLARPRVRWPEFKALARDARRT
ncbi:acyl-CoA dehydrogenase family protein [Streptomyces sp. NPDC005921]